jgi:transcriptional regulator with XRE-family HTH domain
LGRRKISDDDRRFRGDIADLLGKQMKKRNLNQTEAAKELGITKQALSQYLLEKVTPQAEILAHICAKWDVTIPYKGKEFGRKAFRVEERLEKPEIAQMDLFKEPQRVENDRVVVILSRSKQATLEISIQLKEANTGMKPVDIDEQASTQN